MIFSTSTTHALRALVQLAANRGEQATLGRDLAKQVRIPAPYLAKVLATLARADILKASRGARGGYRLARAPGKIRLIEVVEPLEGKRVRPGCLLRPGEACREDGACTAHPAWSEVKAVYTAFLEKTTLADIQAGGASAGAEPPPRRASRNRLRRRGGAGRARQARARHRAATRADAFAPPAGGV